MESSSYDVLEEDTLREDTKPVYALSHLENQLWTMETRRAHSEFMQLENANISINGDIEFDMEMNEYSTRSLNGIVDSNDKILNIHYEMARRNVEDRVVKRRELSMQIVTIVLLVALGGITFPFADDIKGILR
ncbi:hypothetical protein SUGI_1092110 [Cryptomeria japonica]|nr:hypothetical protein SUGI_1092110 [Cryptomeria japonica]